eukprot:m.18038 g.18038  ORF g.18038 m.18038 type:complete len:166 (+) comp6174_c0_seq2:220-717(+)
MQSLTEGENAVLGGTAAFIEGVILQPTLFYKNMRQQGKPLSLDPRVVYRGVSAGLLNEVGSTGVQFLLTGAIKHAVLGGSLRKMTDTEEISSALGAGCIGALFTSPVELVMIQQQNYNLGFVQALRHICSNYSINNGRWFIELTSFSTLNIGFSFSCLLFFFPLS